MTIPTIETVVSSEILLLAARGIGRRRSAGGGQVLMYLLIAAAVIGIVGAAIYFGNKAMHKWRHDSQAGLFSGLCKTHGLSGTMRGLLKQVAGQSGVTYPCQVLVEPQWIKNAAQDGPLKSRARELETLYTRLFS